MQSANSSRLAPGAGNGVTLRSNHQNRETSLRGAELIDGNISSAAGDWSSTQDCWQMYAGLRNADHDLDMAYPLSSWLADRTGTALPLLIIQCDSKLFR